MSESQTQETSGQALFNGSPGTLVCKVYVVSRADLNDAPIKAMNELLCHFNRRTPGKGFYTRPHLCPT